MPDYWTYLCGQRDCPVDPKFVHDEYFGCVPGDFDQRTGRSKTYGQTEGPDGKWRWVAGGCDPA